MIQQGSGLELCPDHLDPGAEQLQTQTKYQVGEKSRTKKHSRRSGNWASCDHHQDFVSWDGSFF